MIAHGLHEQIGHATPLDGWTTDIAMSKSQCFLFFPWS
jgi:hypothetical protein